MPKDPSKNIDRYKVRGGVINEYEYHQNQEALAQNEPPGDGKLIPGTPPEEKTEGLQPSVAATATKSQKQPQKGTKGTTSTKTRKAANRSTPSKTKSSKATKSAKASKSAKAGKTAKKSTSRTMRGATAKKLAARKAAKK